MRSAQPLLMTAFAWFSMAGTVHAQSPAPAVQVAPAYYIAEFEPSDLNALRPYSEQVASTFEQFGGRFIVRGGTASALEGEAPRGRLVVIAFDSVQQAQAWYDSPAYRAIRPIRVGAGRSRTYIVEGLGTN